MLVLFAVMTLLGILWNVITVSLRQSIIPSHLLGRVNSVYRFFAWGMMPIGAAIGGLTVVVVDTFASRDWALRATWLVCAAIHVWLLRVGTGVADHRTARSRPRRGRAQLDGFRRRHAVTALPARRPAVRPRSSPRSPVAAAARRCWRACFSAKSE